MSFLLGLALLLGLGGAKNIKHQEFHGGDFLVSKNGKLEGLPFLNKVYIETKDHKKLAALVSKLNGIKEIKEADEAVGVNGIVIEFNSKAAALEGLNQAVKEFPIVYPVVRFNGLEVLVVNEILVITQPSVKITDYIARLESKVDGKFNVINNLKNSAYVLKVEKLKNPSNVMALATLAASDEFWVKDVIPHFLPLNGPIKPTLSVSTPSITHLGETRQLRLRIDVYDPSAVIRIDLLPQAVMPFPNIGEVWLDFAPMQVKDETVNGSRVVEVTYQFRCVKYGAFTFPPITVSYEWGDELRTKASNFCSFEIGSIIKNTDISDIQPLTIQGLDISKQEVKPLDIKPNYVKQVFQAIKVFGTGGLALMGLFFTCMALVTAVRSFNFGRNNGTEDLWDDLESGLVALGLSIDDKTLKSEYFKAQTLLNKIFMEEFGKSLYAINTAQCNDNFKKLLRELNKVYMEDEQHPPLYDRQTLISAIATFCETREYA